MTVRAQSNLNEEFDDEDNNVNEEKTSSEDDASDSEPNHSSNDENVADNEDEDDAADGNIGWANTFAKVLQQEKPKNKKYLVLSRAKKLSEPKSDEKTEKSSKSITFEIEGKQSSDDENDTVSQAANEEKPSNEELELALLAQKNRNSKLLEVRVKPSVMDRERERSFKRIATKGVVQLFNAVRTQQRDLVDRLEKAGPLDHKRDAVLNNINKRQFLDVLMGGKRAKSENVDNPVKDDPDDVKPSQWSVLRDDFMTNKKIKSHWDNDDSDDDGEGGGNEGAGNFDDMDSD